MAPPLVIVPDTVRVPMEPGLPGASVEPALASKLLWRAPIPPKVPPE